MSDIFVPMLIAYLVPALNAVLTVVAIYALIVLIQALKTYIRNNS